MAKCEEEEDFDRTWLEAREGARGLWLEVTAMEESERK